MTTKREQLYEGMFLLDAREARREDSDLEEQVRQLLEKQGARIEQAGRWEERRLAYEIRGHKRAVYYLAFFRSSTAVIPAIRREAGLAPGILRVLVLRAETVPEDDFFKKKEAPGVGQDASHRAEGGPHGASERKPEVSRKPEEAGSTPASGASDGVALPAAADSKE